MIVDKHGDPIRGSRAQLSTTEPVARSGNVQRAVRGFPRDRPIGYSIAPRPARQIWEQHRIREESRQQSLVSPHFRAFLEWAKRHVIGEDAFGLTFPLLSELEGERLGPASVWLRDEWREHQELEIGARDETLAELAAQCLNWMLVDGDCFVIPFMDGGETRYQSYPGDALAESSHFPALSANPSANQPQRALGITVDSRGRPMLYHFGQRARYRSLGYTSYTSDIDVMDVPAARVWHVRDRRKDGGNVRGWPWIVGAYEYIARLNEFDQAFIRGAIRRVAAGLALKRDPMATFTGDRDGEEAETRDLSDVRIDGSGEFADESVKPYQESEAHAGDILELEPGYDVVNIATGAPSAQEADIVKYFDFRICSALGASPMSLTGNYAGVSFSAGQLALIQERSTVEDLQGIVRRQIVRRVYGDFLEDRWLDLLVRFPRVTPADWRVFARPRHTMRRMPVLEKSKVIPAVLKAFESGLIRFAEARAEAGYSTDDTEAVIAAWRRERDMIGPTSTAPGGGEAMRRRRGRWRRRRRCDLN